MAAARHPILSAESGHISPAQLRQALKTRQACFNGRNVALTRFSRCLDLNRTRRMTLAYLARPMNEATAAHEPPTSQQLKETRPQEASRTGHRESRREILILPGRELIERDGAGDRKQREEGSKRKSRKAESGRQTSCSVTSR